jgi:transposase
MTKARKSYPSDVSDEEWAFSTPYLTLMKEDAPQREHSLRELYNGLRWFVRAGCPWRKIYVRCCGWRHNATVFRRR